MSTGHAAVARVETALREVGDALATPDLDRLLAAEAGLTTALEALTVTSRLELGGADLRDSIDRAYVALRRCRRLGDGLTMFARASSEAAGDPVYSRTGTPVAERAGSLHVKG